MPNHVYNVVTFDCFDKLNEEIIRFVKADDLRPGSIDFNRMVKDPKTGDYVWFDELESAEEG